VDLAAKLQLKPGQHVEIVRPPPTVAPETVTPTAFELVSVGVDQPEAALLVFVTDRSVLEDCREQIVKAASKDRLTWVAYPKAGQLGTDLNRDSLVALLAGSGVQPVRQIAIDEVWSALRFRPA
jgi:hypothetical protein